MDKHRKIHFKAGALTSQELTQRVQHQLTSVDVALFIHRNNFKYFPHFVEQLEFTFTKAAILYSIVKRFPKLTDCEDIDCIALSQQLKEKYTAINLKVMKKKDSFFYFLCIYFTKLAANFLQDTFVDILVEAHLQSQLYISLVHVTIGLQVSPKSYQVNHRKVISEPLSFRTKTYMMSKPDSLQTMTHKPSTKKIHLFQMPSKRLQVKFTFQRKQTHEGRGESPSEVQSFKSSLKQNLLVDVLPKIPAKKLKASQFDKMVQFNQGHNFQSQRQNHLMRAESELIKPTTSFLQSTQNSTSYEMFFKKNDQNFCNMHKMVKISHRPQLMQAVGRKFKKNFDTTIHVDQSQNHEKASESESSRKNWEQIIRNIKQNTVYTTKHNSKSLWADINQNEDTPTSSITFNEHPMSFHYSHGQETDNEHFKPQKERASTNGLLVQPIHLNTQFFEEKQRATEGCQDGFQRQRSQKYRAQRKFFDSQCEHRNIQTAYSVFNANNINSSLVRFGLAHK